MNKLFQRLFPKRKSQQEAEKDGTAPQRSEKNDAITEPEIKLKTGPLSDSSTEEKTESFGPAQFIVGCGQSVGQYRDKNQDTLFSFTVNLAGDREVIPFGLYIVADGMGGHQRGELASQLAVRVMAEHILQNLYLPMLRSDQTVSYMSFQDVLQAGVKNARQSVLSQVPDGGTTLSVMLLVGDRMVLAHIGDSRIYMVYPDNRIEVLTRDHSLVRRLQELGQITSDEAAVHPQRNVLYRALGQGEAADADILTQRLPASGYLLLCSDGLWGVVSEGEIARMVTEAESPQQACHALVDAANAAGGPDNISVIIVQLPTP